MKYVQNLIMLLVIAAACGGTQKPANAQNGPDTAGMADDLDVGSRAMDKAGSGAADRLGDPDRPGDAVTATEPAAPAPVTFRLKNSADQELVFSVDKGWQPVIFAFSGKPPKAKPILMFSKFCTASCEVSADARCPYCPAPETTKDAKAAEKREVVAAGTSLDVPWDGQVFVYEKTRGKQDGKSTSCECYRTQPVPPATYTVRACGLRVTTSATESTKYQCVEGSMVFPAEGPQVVELDFGTP